MGEHNEAFEAYIRTGDHERLDMLNLSSQDDGYVVPKDTEDVIARALLEVSPIRSIASVCEQGTVKHYFPTMELYAIPAATGTLLDDGAVNIDQWIAEELQIAFAELESAALVNGNGINKPKGFLACPEIETLSVGHLQSDNLIDLVYALSSRYRANAHWVMNRKTQSEIRKIKDADGNYIWQPSVVAGQPASLMNFPIAEAEDMPDIGPGNCPIAFGDFRQGYLIVDRFPTRILRDPFSSKPFILLYVTKRVGGGVQDAGAIKLLKCGTSQ